MLPLYRTGILLLLGVTLAACSADNSSGDKKQKALPGKLVAAEEVVSLPLAHSSKLTGTLRALSTVRIFNQEEGAILRIAVHESAAVKQGDVLVEIDDHLLRAQHDKAMATRTQASQDLKRLTTLRKRNLVAEDELLRAKTAFDVADAEEKLLNTRLGYTHIKAPANGLISQRLVEPGDVVPKYTHLLTLIDTTALLTEVSISGLLIPALQVDSPVEVRIDALGDAIHTGKILRIHPALDAVTRRGTVEVILDDPPEGAQPGQLCRVTLHTAEKTRRVIPFIALRRDNTGEYVFIIDENNKTVRRDVLTGLRIGNRIEVLEGLDDDQRVITRGFLGLKPGTAVRTIEAKSKPATK